MRKFSIVLLAGALLLVIALVSISTVMRYRDVMRYNSTLGTTFASEKEHGPRRSLFFDTDSYLWNHYALEVARGNSFRVRTTDIDNHPDGREVHWSSCLIWLLAGAGTLWRFLSGLDLTTSVERASLVINPALFALLLTGAAAITWRRLRNAAATAVVLALGVSPVTLGAFSPAVPDHHGLALSAAFLSLLLLFLAGGGYVRPSDGDRTGEGGTFPLLGEREARRWFIASALCAAAGMWISAVSMTLVIAGIGLGVFVQLTVAGPQERYAPGLWRYWGTAGAAASVFFYLLEYFPGHMGMRLEVNHPLYAVAWWGGANMLAWYGDWRAGSRSGAGKPPWSLFLGMAALIPLPAALWWGGARFYTPFDPFIWRWHEGINEFWPIKPEVLAISFPVLLPLVCTTLVCALWRNRKRPEGGLALLVAVSALLPLALTLLQRRWDVLLSATLAVVPAAAMTVPWGGKPASGRNLRPWGAVVLVALLVQGFFVWRPQVRQFLDQKTRSAPLTVATFAAAHEAAEFLRQAEGDRKLVLLSSSWLSVVMSHVADGQGIASMYWENAAGLKAMADIFTAPSDDEALRLIRERGVTHIVVIASGYNPSSTYYYKFGSTEEEKVDRTFAVSLSTKRPRPWWLTPMSYKSREPLFVSNPLFYRVVIFRVNPMVLGQAPRPAGSPGFPPVP